MFLPLIYSICAFWITVFNPQIISAIPVGEHWMQQIIFGIAVVSVWCVLALGAMSSGDNYRA